MIKTRIFNHLNPIPSIKVFLRTRLFLLFLPEGPKSDTGNLDGLEFASGNITDGVTLTTETGNEDFIVNFDKVQTTVVGDEGGNLLGGTS